MKKTSYAETAIERYKEYQSFIIENISKLNQFQRIYGFSEFNDITIRCVNAEVNCVRYFNKLEVPYNTEPNSLVLHAYQYYVIDKLLEAMEELNRYVIELEMLFIGKQNTFKNKLKEFFTHEDTSKEIFSVSQHHVTKYLRISDEISDIDITRDIDKIIKCYIKHKHDEIMNMPIDNEDIKRRIYESTITVLSNELRTSLKNLGLYQGIYSLDKAIVESLQVEVPKTLKRK